MYIKNVHINFNFSYESPPEYQGNLEMELIWRVLTTTVDHVV